MEYRRAGFWIRFQAFFVDAGLWLLSLTASVWLIIGHSQTLEELIPLAGVWVYYLAFILPALQLFFQVIFTAKFGGGVGKILSGIKVVGDDGNLLSFWRVMFRSIVGYFVSSQLLGAGFFWIARDKRKQGWHDQLTGSQVLQVTRKRWAFASAALILLAFLNSFLITNAIQSIKENRTMEYQVKMMLKEVSGSLLENGKTPATIEPQEISPII